ncbi:MAG: heavy-metal-associated domain-containing protein [Anaerolineaceae bacterium]|nr:heavy-metal-associated domain-containing protein [Anaerolineaceae bacterium]
METITFIVPNISCGHCTMHIKQALSQIDGVEEVEASIESKEVTVEFVKPASKEKLINTLTEINYPPAQ